MKIRGNRERITVDEDGKMAWFDGELGIDGFYAIRSSMRWLPPYDQLPITDFERELLIAKVEKQLQDCKYKVFFV